MAINLGITSISKVYLGSTEVKTAYLGSAQVFSSGPGISSFSPSSVKTGATLTITGSGFSASPVSVTIGAVAANNISVVSDSTITCSAALTLARGSQTVTVTTAAGSVSGSVTILRPTITGFTPTTGTAGADIVISGYDFVSTSSVTFSSVSATNVVVVSSSQITCKVPSLSGGIKDIGVLSNDGTGSGFTASGFTYADPVPTYSSISPPSANAGTTVTIMGTNFVAGATSVTIGGLTAGSVSVSSSTTLTCTVPSGLAAGTAYNVVVTTSGGSAVGYGAFTFTVAPPTYSAISPTSATVGATITVGGTNFVSGGTSVTIGGLTAGSVSVSKATSLTCTVPAGLTPGSVYNVVIATAGGTATGTSAFTYLAPAPTYSSISPASGGTGTSVTITGANFISGTTVTIGGQTANNVSLSGSSSLTCTVPTIGTAGAKNVVIYTSSGTATGTGVFTYTLTPTYTSVSIPQGKAGLSVTVTGSNFAAGMTATVGGVAATCSYVSTTTCTITIPTIGTEGAKNIVLTTAGGSATGTGAFTYYNSYAAVTTTYSTAGSGTYTIPAWANKVDVICMGGGGAGGTGGFVNWGRGGNGGTYSSITYTRGVSPFSYWSATTISYTVGAGGATAANSSVPGGNGATSSADPSGGGGISATGGMGGASLSSPVDTSGMIQAAAITVNGVVYPANTFGGNGNSAAAGPNPGSGGGGGNSGLGPFAGIPGRAGAVYFRAYQ